MFLFENKKNTEITLENSVLFYNNIVQKLFLFLVQELKSSVKRKTQQGVKVYYISDTEFYVTPYSM